MLWKGGGRRGWVVKSQQAQDARVIQIANRGVFCCDNTKHVLLGCLQCIMVVSPQPSPPSLAPPTTADSTAATMAITRYHTTCL